MAEYKMKYTDYRIAAQRHLESCNHIMDCFHSTRKDKKDIRLFWNTYYLSGYIIECSIKFAFFKKIGFNTNEDITTLNYNSGQFTYNHIKSHDLNHLKQYLEIVASSTLPRDIPYVTAIISDIKLNQLVRKWNSEIRYAIGYAGTDPGLDEDLIKNYLKDVVKPIFEKLTQI